MKKNNNQPLTYEETLTEISKYLSNETPYNRIPDVVQYSHFVKGVYIVQTKGYNVRFSPKFLQWLDENDLSHVSLQAVTDDIYAIIVKKE